MGAKVGSSPPDGEETRSLGPAARAETPELAEGARIGRFAVVGRLGAGGMGVVYAAHDPELDRKVAIKLLAYDRDRPREANLRLLREAQAMARLAHPNVVSVFDVGEVDGRMVFLAMEYVDGHTLGDWLAARPRTWREIRDVLVQAGRGLAAAHRSGLVHRDFKPGNLLIDGDGRARVTDFGIARRGDDDSDDGGAAPAPPTPVPSVTPLDIALTRTGSAIGTPAYMAPEQHRGAHVDARADQFAFAVTAWEALYGERPFAGSGAELPRAIAAGQVREPRRDHPVPAFIAPLLRRALAAEPADRWPNLDDLLARLGDDPGGRRRRRLLLGGAALGLLGAGAALAYGMAGRADPPAAPAAAACDADAQLAGVWDAPVSQQVRAAFADTGDRRATAAHARVAAALDAYARDWALRYREACAEAAEAAEQPRDQLICLADRRRQLRTFTTLLGKADAPMIRKAAEAVYALPPARQCARIEGLVRPAPPATAELAAAVDAAREQLGRARALVAIGRYKDGAALAQQALADARQVDYPPLLAEALFVLGESQFGASDAAAAERTLADAALAARAGRHDELEVEALSLRMFALAQQGGRHAEAIQVGAAADAAVRRLGAPDHLRARLLLALGGATYREGLHDQAQRHLEGALAALDDDDPAESLVVARVLNNLALVANEQGRPREALAHHQRALAIKQRLLGDEHPSTAASLQNIGSALVKLGDADGALAALTRAEPIIREAFGAQNPSAAWVTHNIGRALALQGRHAEAIEHQRRVVAIWEQALGPRHQDLADALTKLGESELALGRTRDAIATLTRAVDVVDANSRRGVRPAAARFALARALLAGGKLGRARAMADAARAELVDAGAAGATDLAAVDAWLATNR